jgi:hypothetical protein
MMNFSRIKKNIIPDKVSNNIRLPSASVIALGIIPRKAAPNKVPPAR